MNRFLYTAAILIILFLPLIQKYAALPKDDYKLHGYSESAILTSFSLQSFFEGGYQENVSSWLQENTGFRGYLIALKNQLDYSLFNMLNYGIEMGYDRQLFYWNHIDTHCGHLSLTDDSLHQKIKECVALKSALDSLHIPMVFVLAPGKPFFYEDKLPDKFTGSCSNNNDYNKILSLFNNNRFDFIDFNAWFKTVRGTSKYPLFPRLGTHWSLYGAYLALDSLSKFMESKLNVKIRTYKMVDLALTNQPQGSDKDLWDLLNVLLPMKSDSLAYPKFIYNNEPGHKKPKVLLIGDSFNWTLLDTKMPSELFSSESRFWFYKRQFHEMNSKWITDNPDEVDLYELLKGTDMVIFLSTEVLYHRLDFGFSNALLAHPSVIESLKKKN